MENENLHLFFFFINLALILLINKNIDEENKKGYIHHQVEKWGFFESLLCVMWSMIGFMYLLVEYNQYIYFECKKEK